MPQPEKLSPGVQGSARLSWRSSDEKSLLLQIAEQHRDATRDEIFHLYWEQVKDNETALINIVHYFINNMLTNKESAEKRSRDAGRGADVAGALPQGEHFISSASSGPEVAAVGGQLTESSNGQWIISADLPQQPAAPWAAPDRPRPSYAGVGAVALRRLLGLTINGKPVRDCTVAEAVEFADQRDEDARQATADSRFIRMLVNGLPQDAVIGQHRSQQDMERIAAL